MDLGIQGHEKHYDLFAMRSDGVSFIECVNAALDHPELIAQVDRLYGTNLLRKGVPLELAIDQATGRLGHDMIVFLNFVWECVFLRMAVVEENLKKMKTINEQSLMDALNAAVGSWSEDPFPIDEIPYGHKVKVVKGLVGQNSFMAIEVITEKGDVFYEGTCILAPATMVHLPTSVAKAAFLKGSEQLAKQRG